MLNVSVTPGYPSAGGRVTVAGAIKLMPGTASDPAFRRVDVDVKTGRVHGLHDVD